MQKGKWGRMVSKEAVGRRQGSDLIWTLRLSPALLRAGASKALRSPTFEPASGTHTKWACIIQVVSPAPCSSLGAFAWSLFPQKSIVKLSKQTGWKPLPSTRAARGPRVLTGNQALGAERVCSSSIPNGVDLNSTLSARACRTFQQRSAGESKG